MRAKRLYFFLIPCLLFIACAPAKRSATTGRNNTGSQKVRLDNATADPTPERKFEVVQIKYSEKMGISPESLSNLELYNFIDEWYGTPYRYAGKSKNGVDCSGFMSLLYNSVYQKNISGPSAGLYTLCDPVEKDKLQEGDLVFFRINQNKVSHVGMYLHNNMFIHASTKAGVVISNLNDEYYKKYYYAGGRLK